MRFKLGTSSLVVAAFVGPGTVLTCAAAGVQFGHSLGWVLLFSVAAVFVLQSFTAASGILADQGLGQALREASSNPVLKGLIYALVLVGLWVGTAAFETGNLLGAGAGLQLAFGLGRPVTLVLVAGLAALVLVFDLSAITRLLGGMVALMGVLFLSSALLTETDWFGLLKGLFVPTLPEGSLLTVLALVGTTVVTYNLFLHASASRLYWARSDHRLAWKRELMGMAVFIPLGGVVSLAILATGASIQSGTAPSNIADFAILLEPAAGEASRQLFAAGLFTAGLTSAVTAPLAAAAGISELFGWDRSRHMRRFQLIWISVILTGLFFGLTDISPLQLIVAAQAANGLLLPFIAGMVVFVAFRQSASRLPSWYLSLGILIVVVCAGLGWRTLSWVWGQL